MYLSTFIEIMSYFLRQMSFLWLWLFGIAKKLCNYLVAHCVNVFLKLDASNLFVGFVCFMYLDP